MIHDFRSRLKDYKTRMRLLRGKRDIEGLVEFTEVHKRYNELLHSHEIFQKQQAKTLWLKGGYEFPLLSYNGICKEEEEYHYQIMQCSGVMVC